MNNLYSPVLSENVLFSDLTLTSDDYHFYFESNEDFDGRTSGCLYIYISEEIYEEIVKSAMIDFSDREGYQFSHVEDRDAEVIDHITNNGKDHTRWIRYTITTPEKTLLVEEEYSMAASDTVPRHIEVWVEEGDVRYSVFLLGLDERPSVEWLTSIGVEKYVDADDTSPQ